MGEEQKASGMRYVALDIHKHYSVIGGVNKEGEEVMEMSRVEHAELEGWLQKHLRPSDRVVVESTTNAWHVVDLLEPLVAEVLVANPIKVKQIACARVKTDKKDTLILARLLAANLVPVVWVPPKCVRELRQLVSHRRRLANMHTQVVNRMHSVAHRHHLEHPKGKRFDEQTTGWQRDESLSRLEKMQLALDMETKDHLEQQIERMTRELARMSHEEPWASDLLYLMQIPGCGVVTGMSIIAAIGDIQRFKDPKALASYAGVVPGLEQSGVKLRGKGITKEGRRELRWALVEMAWRAVRADPHWRKCFEELKKRMHPNQAIVAIARHLLTVIWSVLTHHQPYRHYSPERIAYKYLTWAWALHAEERQGMTRPQFARYYLMRLGIGSELKRIALNPKFPYRLASEEDVLTFRPELGPPE
jgi:transposase